MLAFVLNSMWCRVVLSLAGVFAAALFTLATLVFCMATPSLSRSYIRSRTALTLPSSHTGNSLSLQPTATALHQQLLPQGQLLDKFMELIQYMRDFTSETSATLLDASQGVLDCQERWELMQLHQQMFCG